jgi:hypothetical protein
MADDHRDDQQPPHALVYPPWVLSDEERRRWDLAAAIAAHLHAEDGAAQIWYATRAIYQGSIETGE